MANVSAFDDLEDLLEGTDETEVELVEEAGVKLPITHWSYSSLMAFLRNPLAWYKRYVEHVYDTPVTPSSIIGRSAHVALQHFYGGILKEGAIDLGLEYLKNVPDFEINFGKAKSRKAKKEKRQTIEREYLQAINFYLARPPRYKKILGIEVKALAKLEGLPIPIKAISDLVVLSPHRGAVDIVDHKFVDYFSQYGGNKTLFVIQAIFNYYAVKEHLGRPVRRFIIQECRKKKNKDGSPQMRRYVIDFKKYKEEFAIFHRLLRDATDEIARPRTYLPNPTDMFDGENSFDIYRQRLVD